VTPTATVSVANVGTRAIAIGRQPASPLRSPGTLVLVSAGQTIGVILDGPPIAWIDAINRVSGRTGVDALITDRTTLLEDGTLADPFGDGYLMLRTRQRGRATTVTVGFRGPPDATGFTVTDATAAGED
jgi:hypothetical protein